jgi:hypothetical protein
LLLIAAISAHSRRLASAGLAWGRSRGAARSGRACVRLVRSSPAPVAPWQIPSATRPHATRHEIKAARARWVATAQPRQGDPTAGPQSKSCDRLVGVIRTGRQVSTMHADQWRKRIAVERDHAPGCAPRRTTGRFKRPIEGDGGSQAIRQQTRPRAWFRAGQWPTPQRQTSAWLRHGVPCNRAPVLVPRYLPICRSAAPRSP